MADEPEDGYEIMKPMKKLPPAPKRFKSTTSVHHSTTTGLDEKSHDVGSSICLKIQLVGAIFMFIISAALTGLTLFSQHK